MADDESTGDGYSADTPANSVRLWARVKAMNSLIYDASAPAGVVAA